MEPGAVAEIQLQDNEDWVRIMPLEMGRNGIPSDGIYFTNRADEPNNGLGIEHEEKRIQG